MTPGRSTQGFFGRAWSGSAPLVLWAAHFALCYVALALGCTAILGGSMLMTPDLLRLALAAATGIAVLAGLWLLLRAWRAAGPGHGHGGLLGRVRLVVAGLSLVAMLWTGLPLALLPLCHAA